MSDVSIPDPESPEFQQWVEEQGAGGGGGGFFGSDLAPDSPVAIEIGGSPTPGYPSALIPGPVTGTTTINDLLKVFYRMTPDMTKRLQAILYAGGYFDSMNIEDIRWGNADDVSFTAWARAVRQAASITAAEGRDTTIQDVLFGAARAGGIDPEMPTGMLIEELEQLGAAEGMETVRPIEGDVISISLTDPNRLRKDIDDVATAVLGRKANPEEQRMFLALMHNQERTGQTALQTAEPETIFAELDPELLEAASTDPAAAMALEASLPDPEDVTVEYAQPDSAAQAEMLLRMQNPAEAGAHDIAIQFANFMDMINSPVDVPRTVYGEFQGGGF